MQYAKKYKWYINENEGWQQMIRQQAKEIPHLEKMLKSITSEDVLAKDEKQRGKSHFDKQLEIQQKEMLMINNELGIQQKRLALDCQNNINNDIDAFCTQDILRQRIRDIEKTYLELKCNFMVYLSTVL